MFGQKDSIRKLNELLYRLVMIGRMRKSSPKRIEFGCGPNLTDGFVGCDIRWFPGVKYVCDAWKICSYVNYGVVEEIYSRHFLEHLTFHQAELTIQCWTKILKPSGTLRICVPDIDYHIVQFQSNNWDSPSEANPAWTVHQHAIAGFWGWQRESNTKLWDVHKSGYNLTMLQIWLEKNGYQYVERIPDQPWNLHVKATRL